MTDFHPQAGRVGKTLESTWAKTLGPSTDMHRTLRYSLTFKFCAFLQLYATSQNKATEQRTSLTLAVCVRTCMEPKACDRPSSPLTLQPLHFAALLLSLRFFLLVSEGDPRAVLASVSLALTAN